jgi:glycosyltransferase involved in cell wall biosynthesis
MPYMVRDGESGFLVDPNDPEDIAARLAEVLTDPVRRAKMGQHCRETAKDRFHPSRIAHRTREVYMRAIRDHAKTR